MTNQEAFDRAALHLLRQGRRSESGKKCLYRGPNGTRCAVGALIPDDQYSPMFELQLAHDIAEDCPALQGVDVNLLDGLQSIHDNVDVARWPDWLIAEAKQFGLSDAVVREFQTGGV